MRTSPFKMTMAIFGIVAIIILAVISGNLVEQNGADEILVVQSPVSGELTFHTTSGLKWQGLGSTTKYQKSFQYWFSAHSDQGDKGDQSVKTRFNDGGHAKISGSVRIDMPLSEDKLTPIHEKYGSQYAVENELIRPTFEKSIYMAGPLMSSKESYSEKRNELIRYIEDQATHGVYKTSSKEVRGVDPLSGQEKTITVVDLQKDDNSPGGFARQEKSPIVEFGLRPYNLSINAINYDATIDKQIATQQEAIMQVQTAIAQAKKAEQDAIKAEKEGQAQAAIAKWEQEKLNAKEIALAEKNLKVAEFKKNEAKQYKEEKILRGEGEAKYKELVMTADGALAQKLEAYTAVWGALAPAIASQPWVPNNQIVYGSNGQDVSGGSAVQQTIDMFNMKLLKDLGLDMDIAGKVAKK